MHVGQHLVDRLIDYGVSRIFGVPGGQTLPLYDGVSRRLDKVSHVLMRSETNAAYAADAYARMTGTVGVCDATVGAGTVHLVPGLVEALTSSVPIMAIVGDIPRQWSTRRHLASASQGFEQRAFLEPCVKSYGRVDVPGALNHVVHHALRLATSGRPGPVVVEIPVDIFAGDSVAKDFPIDDTWIRYPRLRSAGDPADIARAANELVRAQRPIVLAGGGALAAGAGEELTALIELLGAPLVTTLSGKGVVSETHRLSAGVCGSFGMPLANSLLRDADCVLLVGTKAGQGSTFDWREPTMDTVTIHIDIDPDEIGRNYYNSVPIVADAREGVRALRGVVKRETPTAWRLDRMRAEKQEWWERTAWESRPVASNGSTTPETMPQDVMRLLRDLTREDDVLVADASLASGWAASRWQTVTSGRRFIAPRGVAGLGWGLPAAIGAALAIEDGRANGRVVCLAGDGGLGYSLGELETAARLRLPIIIVVLNNASLAWTKHGAADHFSGDTISQDFTDVDFAAVGRALGCEGHRVEHSHDLADALRSATRPDRPGPAVVDVRTSGAESPVLRAPRRGSAKPAVEQTGY